MSLVIDAVTALKIKSKVGQPDEGNPERLRLRVGGYDRRKEVFKGWVEIEPYEYQGRDGSFCIMSRDQVMLTLLITLEKGESDVCSATRATQSLGDSSGRRSYDLLGLSRMYCVVDDLLVGKYRTPLVYKHRVCL